MRKLSFLLIILISFCTSAGFAQLKIGYVDSDTIMDNLPDVLDARQELDALITEWQNELRRLEADWKTKYEDYEKRKLIMTEQTRADTETELVALEEEIAQFREKKFGASGELFQKQDELMNPVQNKIFTAIQELAEEEELDFVFDRSGDIMLLYANEEFDLTARVIEKLSLE
ncbi:MAG: OmpH family outer membrane protein [Ignavibacteriae bacterium]|nr:MAG: OmpH family outer membrane protein [Ignavibacteriota bacterium]